MAAIKKGASYDEVMQAVAEGDQDAIEVASSGGLASSEERGETAKKRAKILLILGAMGPGVVSAMAGNDAGGISTYSTAGADFGYATLWVIPVMCVLLMVVQMTAARMGAVTGK
ncbi:MAG: divalent metal cation transporter, partial [Eggerthellaceae bacterium]